MKKCCDKESTRELELVMIGMADTVVAISKQKSKSIKTFVPEIVETYGF